MNTAIIGFGSNIEPQKNIAKAKESLREHYKILAESKFVQTAPVGYAQQDDFINGTVLSQMNTPL